MPDILDVNALIGDIQSGVTDIIREDVTALSGFEARQIEKLAKRAALIAEMTLARQIDEEQRAFFLDDLARDAKTFAKTVAALVAITIEKIWNTVVEKIWGAINGVIETAVGALPLPTFPNDG